MQTVTADDGTFFREAGGIDQPTQLPIWPDEVAFHLADTIVRESRAVEVYSLDDDISINAPVTLLRSEYGPTHLRNTVDVLHDQLPESSLVELDSTGHSGISTAPEQLATKIQTVGTRDRN